MFDSTPAWIDLVWRGALAATIPAIIIAVIGRFLTTRPPTRHTLWLTVLAWFVVAPLLPSPPHGKIASFFVDQEGPRGPVIQGPSETDLDNKLTASPRFSNISGLKSPDSSSPSAPLPSSLDTTTRDSIHARTGPPAPNRLARAPRPVGHGLTEMEADPPVITIDSSVTPEAASITEEKNSHRITEMEPATHWTEKPLPAREPPRPRHNPKKHYQPITESVKKRFSAVSATASPQTLNDSPSAVAVWIGACRSAARSMKDALARIPALPPVVWLSGIFLVLAARGIAYARYARSVRSARRAPSSIQRMIRRSARDIGVSPAPQVLMIAGRFSPMVSFIGKRRLLLPDELWSQLDEPGRQAIVYHELAHLRRRDDWVRWFENAVNCLYWWHPVVWWLCRRLHEEAENCCDAWVTWLMPKGRRAYAEALLTTSRYVGSSSTALPVVGIGATSVRAKRFARRLTMVMTNPSRPRMSLSGAALAAALALAAWLATPAWSSPPKTEPLIRTPNPAIPMTPPADRSPVATPTPAAVPATPTPPSLTTATVAPPATALTPPALLDAIGTTVAKSLMSATEFPPERKRSEDIEARLDRLERRLEELTERLAGQPAPQAVAAPRRVFAVPSGRGGQPGVVAVAPRSRNAVDGPKEWRHYNLPEGKLDALTNLMARDDVPVLVRQQGDGIEVEATPAQHEVFEAFVRMINPAGGEGGGAFRARAAQPRQAPAPAQRKRAARRSPANIAQRADEIRSLATAKEAEHDALEAQRDQMEALAESLRDRAEALKDSAEHLSAESKAKALQQAAEILEKSHAMTGNMEKLEVELKKAAEELQKLESQADRLDDQADADDDPDDEGDDDADDAHGAAAAHDLDHAAPHNKVKSKEKDAERAKALHKADELFAKHQWKDAAAEYEKFIETHPDDGRAWYNLGYSYHMAKQFERAFKSFERSADLDTRKGDSLYNIACGYSLQGDKDQAIEWLERAIDAGYRDANNMKGDSDLNNIRNDARYQKIVEELGASDGGV